MLRVLLALSSLLLLVWVPSGELSEPLAEVAGECHCCSESGEAAGDCCDWDAGACCATGVAAALPVPRAPSAEHGPPPRGNRAAAPLHLLRPRDDGPPPTPPPRG